MADNSRPGRSQLLSLAAVGRLLGRTPGTLRRWEKAGGMPAPRVTQPRKYWAYGDIVDYFGLKTEGGDDQPKEDET